MEITLRTELPNFTDDQVAQWYNVGIPFWEMMAVAIEAYRQPNSQDFFTETLCVMSITDDGYAVIETGNVIWGLIYPWLTQLYRKCPAFHNGTVSRIDMFDDDRSLNIQLYVETQ